MNRFEAERRFVQRMKDNYPPGTRLMLLQMGDDPRPIEPNKDNPVNWYPWGKAAFQKAA